MPSPFIKSPLGGILGVRSGSLYRLDPTGTVPLSTVGEFVNPFDPQKFALDVTDSEDWSIPFQVTENPLQDFSSASTNVHKLLESVSVSGTMISSLDLGLLASVGFPGLRADLVKFENLRALADKKEPVLFVSPRGSMPKAFIESVTLSWNPELGDNSLVTMSLREARIVSPLTAAAVVPDVEASFTGNNATKPVGTQAAAPVQTQETIPPEAFGLPPTVVPFF